MAWNLHSLIYTRALFHQRPSLPLVWVLSGPTLSCFCPVKGGELQPLTNTYFRAALMHINNVFQNEQEGPHMKSDIWALKWELCAIIMHPAHAPLPIFATWRLTLLCRQLQHPSWDCKSCHLLPLPSWQAGKNYILLPRSSPPCHFIF